MRIVYTAGVWDLLHTGHRNLLQRSKALGDILVVGVVTDDGAAAYKRRPFQDQDMRLGNVRDLRYVDFAVLQDTTDPSHQLRAIRPAMMTHGDDWQQLLQGNETLAELGIQLILLPYTKGVSTSALLAMLAARGEAVT
jgi:cytidyltransferase-like protein